MKDRRTAIAAAAGAMIATSLLAGCAGNGVATGSGVVISRLPPGTPGAAAPAPAAAQMPDPAEQMRRFNEVDRRALEESERAMREQAAIALAQAAAPRIDYYGWGPGYGGWYGPGWGPVWDVGGYGGYRGQSRWYFGGGWGW